MKKLLALVVALVLVLSLATVASAAEYPTKGISVICPWGAGGGTDSCLRAFCLALEKQLGVTLTVDNLTGAGGVIGHEAVADADPDGYTMGMVTFELSAYLAQEMSDYTYENYQYDLAGLTPAEFYKYVTTGVYPCSEYFGVDSKRLNTLDELIACRKQESEKLAQKARERAARDKQEGLSGAGKDPIAVIKRDIRILEKKLEEWVNLRQMAIQQLEFLDRVLSKAEAALKFIAAASEELKNRLRTREEWSLHPELAYIYDMKGLF